MNNLIQTMRQRELWPDCLRIIAAFAVVVLHSASAGCYGRFYADSSQFMACNFYDSLVHFCVPLFVMLSGMFLLDNHREYPPKKIFFVKLWRITIAFVIWSTFYSIIELVEQIHRHTFNPRDFMHNLIIGQYHMWFIYMLAGLYIATPVLRLIAQNETICKYFMVLAFCCIFLGNCIFNLPFIGGTLLVAFHRLDLNVISGFSLYFLLGHWLANHKLNNKQRKLIYALGIFSLIFTIGFNLEYSIYRQNAHEWIFNYLYPNILFITIAFFVFGQYNFSKIKFSEKQCQFISLTAKLSFGIYLVHVLFLEHLYLVGLPHFFIHPWLSIPITACLTFILSFAASYLLNKIPILNKYIV